MGTFSLLTLPGDNGTWSVTAWASSSDAPLRRLGDPQRLARVVDACPLHAHWLDGHPITEVLTMAGALDRYHRPRPGGLPGALDITMCLAHRDQVLARPGFMDKLHAVGAAQPARLPGPDRSSLLELLA